LKHQASIQGAIYREGLQKSKNGAGYTGYIIKEITPITLPYDLKTLYLLFPILYHIDI
jgi:hypothetical protein